MPSFKIQYNWLRYIFAFYWFLTIMPISTHTTMAMVKTTTNRVFSGSQGDDLTAGHFGWHVSGESFLGDWSPDWWLLLSFIPLPQHPVTTTSFISVPSTRSISIDSLCAPPISSFGLHAEFSYPFLQLAISTQFDILLLSVDCK